ncbi:hypothetical protein Pcinc_034982 [Petrolisthes cinctipes]|uniref:Uncharacterized protein n=1 Tax=Petrolisthes cinctipes TaxID=88211 RepID=A0AAE1EPL7_PETCI|nr:hypothetical protein Pcinc_034982 [Petrolisthes cinctipes]
MEYDTFLNTNHREYHGPNLLLEYQRMEYDTFLNTNHPTDHLMGYPMDTNTFLNTMGYTMDTTIFLNTNQGTMGHTT